jgi:hypothetical protein
MAPVINRRFLWIPECSHISKIQCGFWLLWLTVHCFILCGHFFKLSFLTHLNARHRLLGHGKSEWCNMAARHPKSAPQIRSVTYHICSDLHGKLLPPMFIWAVLYLHAIFKKLEALKDRFYVWPGLWSPSVGKLTEVFGLLSPHVFTLLACAWSLLQLLSLLLLRFNILCIPTITLQRVCLLPSSLILSSTVSYPGISIWDGSV